MMGLSSRLRGKVTIQENQRVRSGTGWEAKWVDVAAVRAEILAANGGEAFAQGVQRQTQFYRVTIRYRRDVTPQHRLIWSKNGEEIPLDIRTCADPDNKRAALLIIAESGVPT